MDEALHAAFLVSVFRALYALRGEKNGKDIFLAAVRAYGERRGRRMALRALCDGYSLDFASYFAYGELLPTENAYVGSYAASSGMICEKQFRCPWASAFAELGAPKCAKVYCAEIDAAILRGFSPELCMKMPKSIHTDGVCEFYYEEESLTERTLDELSQLRVPSMQVKRDMHFHCADVYEMFCRVLHGALREDEWDEVYRRLQEDLGQGRLEMLEQKCAEYQSAMREDGIL